VVKSGIPWRYLPADFPPWKTVCHIFRQGTLNHQWAALNAARRLLVRKTDGKRAQLTAAILDSQSVKSAGHGGNVGATRHAEIVILLQPVHNSGVVLK
jgi:transposase